ncbi:MAG TPA: 2-amino-4-hydroxy-6-hydroxymethyldihydropteridine diphosphokinase [Polyangiaceae bacterium]|nr:2-amino-4-hydroxy-6-hydroxymethyldihydropteridine diphosphokinase [Polyangiaceae bacterium]
MESSLKTVALSLGSNVGNSRETLRNTVTRDLTPLHEGAAPLRCSSVYRTAAWGKREQAAFLNLAVVMESALLPKQLLRAFQSIEDRHGRVRAERWGPRTLDIDLLLYGDEQWDEPDLRIPHPYMHERAFVLTPLVEIAPELVHPVLRKSILALASSCADDPSVTRCGPL